MTCVGVEAHGREPAGEIGLEDRAVDDVVPAGDEYTPESGDGRRQRARVALGPAAYLELVHRPARPAELFVHDRRRLRVAEGDDIDLDAVPVDVLGDRHDRPLEPADLERRYNERDPQPRVARHPCLYVVSGASGPAVRALCAGAARVRGAGLRRPKVLSTVHIARLSAR